MPKAPPKHQRPTIARQHFTGITNRQTTRTYNTGSKIWRAIRRQVLVRDHYTCRTCGKYGNEVDHIDGDSGNNPNDGTNWQTLCKSCHSKKTARETLPNLTGSK